MLELLDGRVAEDDIVRLLAALRTKGETVDELVGFATAMRRRAREVESLSNLDGAMLVDTCGTGGGAVGTFNISTAAAFVAAGAGASVAKHGNRSFTSRCGSADVLEALGVSITLDAPNAARVLREACMTFLFAPSFHPAMRHVGPVRKELGVPSVMNLVGPLANPAGVRRQVLGVADRDRAPLMAEALARLGAEHAMVVHARVGMDEIAPHGITDVWEVRDGRVTCWELDAEHYGHAIEDLTALGGSTPKENAERVERLLKGDGGDREGRAAVILNAGAAVYVAGLAPSYARGIERAADALARGGGHKALERLRRASTSTSE